MGATVPTFRLPCTVTPKQEGNCTQPLVVGVLLHNGQYNRPACSTGMYQPMQVPLQWVIPFECPQALASLRWREVLAGRQPEPDQELHVPRFFAWLGAGTFRGRKGNPRRATVSGHSPVTTG